jgi:hypothetical protein
MSYFIYCFAECYYAEHRYAECHYGECHYAECHGAEAHTAIQWQKYEAGSYFLAASTTISLQDTTSNFCHWMAACAKVP